ncbi:MAG: FG-GAP-like repeat-containing protein, partial [Gemmataceae bacterium]|nr:FG-GAP-like repeat-containing protein [Gemmataceae bacterium]
MTWASVSTTLRPNNVNVPQKIVVTDLEYTVDQGRLTLFAGVGNVNGSPNNGIWIGTEQNNGTVAWVPRLENDGLPLPAAIQRISLASDHVSTVYAAINMPGQTVKSNVFKTTDNGQAWEATNPPGNFVGTQGNYNLAIGLSPNGRVYIGGQEPDEGGGSYLLESSVGATGWRAINQGPNGLQPHADSHAFAFGPDGTVYLGNDGGIYRYDPLPFDPGFVSSDTGGEIRAAATSDFNRDGKLDVAVIVNGSVALMYGLGNGTFSRLVTPIPVGRNPVAIVAGDFNRDGLADLAVVNNASGSVSILIQNANGTFQAAQDFAVGPVPSFIAVGDFNGDGKLDLVVMDGLGGPGSGRFLRGAGDGTFVVAQNGFDTGTTRSTASRPGALVAGDFNGDGKLDLAVTNYGAIDGTGGGVNVLLGNGDGTFGAALATATGKGTRSLAAGDFNGDGILDLAAINEITDGGTLSILQGKGNGTFAVTQTEPGRRAFAVAVADFNGDGKQDIVVAREITRSLGMFLGNGNGSFQAVVPMATGQQAVQPPILIAADFNGDGKADVVVKQGATLGFMLNNPGVSSTGRGNWANLNSAGLQTSQAYSIAVSPTDPLTMLIASHDNGVARTTDGGKTWNTVLTPDLRQGNPGGTDGLTVEWAADGMTAYLVNASGPDAHPGLYRSDDKGVTWKYVGEGLITGTGGVQGGAPLPLLIKPTDPKVIIVGGFDGKLFLSASGGRVWAPVAGPRGVSSAVTAMAWGTARNELPQYIGLGDGSLYKRAAGKTLDWVSIGGPWGNRVVSSIAVDPSNPAVIYVTLKDPDPNANSQNGSQVWRTTNGGTSWVPIAFSGGNASTRTLPNFRVFKVVAEPNSVVYIATDLGVYKGTLQQGLWAWAPLSTGMPNAIVRDLRLQTYGTQKFLVAATIGRGGWITALAGGTTPTVTALDFNGDQLAGGREITITGTGFNGATAVLFGNTYARTFRIVSDTSIVVVPPPATDTGTVDVKVVAAGGTSAASPADRFTYFSNQLPQVNGLSTVSDVPAGGSVLVISGTRFLGTHQVLFGNARAKFVVNSDSQITVIVPANAAGTVDVRVNNASGLSLVNLSDKFTYLTPGTAIVRRVGVGSGPTAGGTVVNIMGTNLSGTVKVLFGETEAAFVVQSDVLITATAPPHLAGAVDVRAITRGSNGGEVTSPTMPGDVFRYVTAQGRTSLSTSEDPSVFGQPVTLTATVAAENAGDGTPTGSVIFMEGGTVIAVEALINGIAEFTTSSFGLGIHELVAVYQGDDNFLGSTSAPLDQIVAAPIGTVILNALNNSTTAMVSFNDSAGHSGSVTTFLSQFNVTFNGGGVSSLPFATFCIDLLHTVTVGESWGVNFRNDLDAAFVSGGSAMAYLFQQYGMADLTSNPTLAAALQLDLSLGGTPTAFTQQVDGSYRSSGGGDIFLSVDLGSNLDAAMIIALANDLLLESSAATAHGGWFDSSATDEPNRGQSLLMPANLPVVVGTTVDMTEGQSASVTVATILYTGPGTQAADFQASVNWGDGSAVDTN